MVNLQDAPPQQTGITQTQLSGMIEGALTSALETRFGTAQAAPAADPNAATLALEPQHASLRALHQWTLEGSTEPVREDQVILLNQDGVEILDADEYDRRYAALGQPSFAGTINQLNNIGGFDIPWGDVLFGILPGAIVSEVVDGLMAPRNADGSINFQNIGVKALIAGVGVQFGAQFVGKRTAQFFAGGLILFILADLLPIDQWVANIIKLFNRDNGDASMSAHESMLARHNQSPSTPLDPTQGTDPLEALRGLQQFGIAA